MCAKFHAKISIFPGIMEKKNSKNFYLHCITLYPASDKFLGRSLVKIKSSKYRIGKPVKGRTRHGYVTNNTLKVQIFAELIFALSAKFIGLMLIHCSFKILHKIIINAITLFLNSLVQFNCLYTGIAWPIGIHWLQVVAL